MTLPLADACTSEKFSKAPNFKDSEWPLSDGGMRSLIQCYLNNWALFILGNPQNGHIQKMGVCRMDMRVLRDLVRIMCLILPTRTSSIRTDRSCAPYITGKLNAVAEFPHTGSQLLSLYQKMSIKLTRFHDCLWMATLRERKGELEGISVGLMNFTWYGVGEVEALRPATSRNHTVLPGFIRVQDLYTNSVYSKFYGGGRYAHRKFLIHFLMRLQVLLHRRAHNLSTLEQLPDSTLGVKKYSFLTASKILVHANSACSMISLA